ncbi:unnamed protein product [Malus baccata var. baccata]
MSYLKWENPNHPLYLHHSNQHGAVLVPQPLAEDNYSTWVQSINMALTVKNKLGLVDGMIKKLSEDKNEELQQWNHCNNLVKRWLLGSMSKEISGTLSTAKMLDRYGLICKKSFPICETKKEITSYVETQKTMKFLMGLNDSYATARSNTLFLEPLPTVNKAYSLVLRHEQQAKIVGHTFEFCHKRKIAAENESSRPFSSKGNQVTTHDKREAMPSFPFSQEDCKQILQMLNKNKSSFANQVGNSLNVEDLLGKAFSFTYNGKKNIWILDNGATDHIVCSSDLLTHSRPVENHTVELPNGSFAKVTHIGQIIFFPNLSLDNVLCVPPFRSNLISISKLAYDSLHITIFLSHFCVIQDLCSRKMIGTEIEQEGLYYLDPPKKGTCNNIQVPNISSLL